MTIDRLLTHAALLSPSYVIESAWLEHAPFATWLVEKLRPKSFVELGTHRGYSYFAICEAIRNFGLGTKCHAVDTFAGDEHAGFYGEEIYNNVINENQKYADFSSVHRSLFSDAVHLFSDKSIDLIHIDGRHFYKDVKEDYETWLPKLSDQAVVIFHDVVVRDREFGVWKLFSELKSVHPHFEFYHNNGLGVIIPGRTPAALEALFSLNDEDAILLRSTMERLGKRFTLQFQKRHIETVLASVQSEAVSLATQLHEANINFNRVGSQTEVIRQELLEANQKIQEVSSLLHSRNLEIEETQEKVASALTERDAAEQRLKAIEASTFWRGTSLLRKAVHRLPPSIKRICRSLVRAGYWVITPHRTAGRLRALKLADTGAIQLGSNLDSSSATAEILKGGANPFDRRIYDLWIRRRDTLTSQDRIQIRESINAFRERPLISIVMPVYNTPASVLREAISSVRRQLYPHWELCIADDASPQPHVKELLAELAAEEPRIRWMSRETNGHISLASNSALELASGEFVALMDHDDLLAEHALYEIVAALQNNIDADIFYSDEDKIDERGERHDPYFKPDFSYDQMLGQNFISHLGVYRRSLLSKVGGFRAGFEGSQDYDLALRCIEHTKAYKIVHIPEILYHWRQQSASASFSQTELDRCVAASRKALQEHLSNSADDAGTALIDTNPIVPSWNRVRWPLPKPLPLVSIIIPTRDRADLLGQCVDGLLNRTAYENFEIIVVDNESVEPETAALFADWTESEKIRVYSVGGPFNFSRLNNEAAQIAKGSILVLLNNDVDVIDSDWLNELVSLAIRPDIGCVGAKLLYADKRVQHAGVRLGAGHFDGGPGVAGHLGLFRSAGDPGYFGNFAIARDVGCVTAACLAVRKEIYDAVGGLDETNLAVAFNDVDFCLRVRSAGYRILWTPFAELLHLESASRGSDQTPEKQARFHNEARYVRERWASELDSDPFYNRHFNNFENDYELQMSPGRERSWHREARKRQS